MNRCVLRLIFACVLLPLGCGDPTGPRPSELCSDHPDAAIATFEDANLEAAIRAALSVGAQEDLTCGLVSGLTALTAWGPPKGPSDWIVSLLGIQNLTSLTFLDLASNSITDISVLSGLTSLTSLNLIENSITDIALSGLPNLTFLNLRRNPFTDITLSGLTSLTELDLLQNQITNITLGGLTSLTELHLPRNQTTNIPQMFGGNQEGYLKQVSIETGLRPEHTRDPDSCNTYEFRDYGGIQPLPCEWQQADFRPLHHQRAGHTRNLVKDLGRRRDLRYDETPCTFYASDGSLSYVDYPGRVRGPCATLAHVTKTTLV